MSFLFKKKSDSPVSPPLGKDDRDKYPDPPQLHPDHPAMQAAPHHQQSLHSHSVQPVLIPQRDPHQQDFAPMSVSPMSTSPLSSPLTTMRTSPSIHQHYSDRDMQQTPTSSAQSSQQSTFSSMQQPAPFAHPVSSSNPSSSDVTSTPTRPISTSTTTPSTTSSTSSSSSFPPSFSAPSSPTSTSRDPSLVFDLPPFPVQEEKLSDDTIILRQHFHSLPSLSRHLFTIGDTLGTGTFGRVRLVSYHHAPLSPKQLHFALKMLKKSEILRLKQVEHIKAEKSILSRIVHPFIVNLFASWQDDTVLYMLMEYVIGGELFSQLRKVGRFSNDTARFYAAEIVLALQYLHSKDIVYRDLKPENLLIDREGHIKITDFGFAKVVEDRTWTLCGTPEYLAPEIIQSKGHGKAVDWWALGILIYEMIAGYPPFYDENPFGIYQKILAGRIDFPKHFDPYAKDLVKKLLTADRSKRFGCLKEGADDIKRHRWFKGVDWGRVHARRVKPPYVPGFASGDDTSNFDKYPDSDGEEGGTPLNAKDKEQFVDF